MRYSLPPAAIGLLPDSSTRDDPGPRKAALRSPRDSYPPVLHHRTPRTSKTNSENLNSHLASSLEASVGMDVGKSGVQIVNIDPRHTILGLCGGSDNQIMLNPGYLNVLSRQATRKSQSATQQVHSPTIHHRTTPRHQLIRRRTGGNVLPVRKQSWQSHNQTSISSVHVHGQLTKTIDV